MPARFAQGDGLADQPTARANQRSILFPMFRFVNRLTVEFEHKLGMARVQNIGIDILVAGDTRVRTRIKISEIVHPGTDARCVGPIGPGVSAQPRFGGAVTTFARHAFVRARG